MAIMIAVSVLVAGVTLLALGRFLRNLAGVEAGEIFYSDTGAEEEPCRTLVSEKYGLVGRPDYLIRKRGKIIPVEVKSTKMPSSGPYASHEMQLAAYCLLVEDCFGVIPPYGVIRYRDGGVRVKYDGELRARLLDAVESVRRARALPLSAVHRSHDRVGRCRGCAFREVCGEVAA